MNLHLAFAATSRVARPYRMTPTLSRTTTGTPNHSTLRLFTSLNQATPFSLCFLRHGQSTWNRDNRFIGWTDTPLTEQGVLEARVAGQMLRNSNMQFDEVHTSLLRRSIRTTNIVLMETSQEYIPVYKSWRLNERNYGDLVGKHKKQCVAECGAEQVKRWRRSYDEPPPPMCDDHPFHPANDPRYRNVRVIVALWWLVIET
jgi:2,3-bisphosphoglycerate-dependent phosphoglycerate mutase